MLNTFPRPAQVFGQEAPRQLSQNEPLLFPVIERYTIAALVGLLAANIENQRLLICKPEFCAAYPRAHAALVLLTLLAWAWTTFRLQEKRARRRRLQERMARR